MAAPTRVPQARGVKCDLCQLILKLATWLNQKFLAKNVEEPRNVINLIRQHQKSKCPCIPKNIENLLLGSTHFEIHRLVSAKLDDQIHQLQSEIIVNCSRKEAKQPRIINDCYDNSKKSRFKVCRVENYEKSKQQLKHLCRAIDYWRSAMEDQANPFHSALAFRLDLQCHVIYACYYFKFSKLIDYQLITANLLLNICRSIDAIKPNALLHAYYLIIKTLIDCDQLQLARLYLKQVVKCPDLCTYYNNKDYFESILLTCAQCELELLSGGDIYTIFDELEGLVNSRPGDKLQHEFARFTALKLILKYVNCYTSRSDYCSEFFYTFRSIGGIIRLLYGDSYQLLMQDVQLSNRKIKASQPANDSQVNKQPLKDLPANKQSQQDLQDGDNQTNKSTQSRILNHMWIKFAICDLTYSTFDIISEFYVRAGIPENLEMLYNLLSIVSFRSGSCYWPSRIAAIGASLDLLYDKQNDAEAKLDTQSKITAYPEDSHLTDLLPLESNVARLSISTDITSEKVQIHLTSIKTCSSLLKSKLSQTELYDCKSNSSHKICIPEDPDSSLVIIGGHLGKLSLSTVKMGVRSLLEQSLTSEAKHLISLLSLSSSITCNSRVLDFSDSQLLLEILIQFADIDKSEQSLLESVGCSSLFLRNTTETGLDVKGKKCQSDSELPEGTDVVQPQKNSRTQGVSRLTRKKRTYEVTKAEDTRLFDVKGAILNFDSLSREELVALYLRNSEPNPDYLLYRRCHELMLSFRLSEEKPSHDLILYHFSESMTGITMRYRWMEIEEKLNCPHIRTDNGGDSNPDEGRLSPTQLKSLGFCNSLINQEKTIRNMTRALPDNYRLVQIKYNFDVDNKLEHIICCCLDGGGTGEPVYIHATRDVEPDDFLEVDHVKYTIPNRMISNIDEYRKTLNKRASSGQKSKIDAEVQHVLGDMGREWLAPFQFILCGKVHDMKYCKFVASTIEKLLSTLAGYTCRSSSGLHWFIENAPLFSRQEFCHTMSILFDCQPDCDGVRESYRIWLKSMEAYMADEATDKDRYMQTLARGQLGLALDNRLESLPFESLRITRTTKQALFRVPSLRILHTLVIRDRTKVDPSQTAFVLDPAGDLVNSSATFGAELKNRLAQGWHGTMKEAPRELEQWLAEKQLFIYIGHGTGERYYNEGAMKRVRAALIIMGCSSARMQARGCQLETWGIGWKLIFMGAPCYMGLLWDVSETDIDRYLDTLLATWVPAMWRPVASASSIKTQSMAKAAAQARHACKLQYLVGSSPVIYGLPIFASTGTK